MKKFLTILLTILMILTLIGCSSNEEDKVVLEDPPIVQEESKEEAEQIVGGFVEVEDGTLTDELKEIFEKALNGLMGASYDPQKLVATQVVAGTNYKFLANGTKTTNPIVKGTYYITIYKDLQGNVELKDIEIIEEKEIDYTGVKFWVVVYDQFENEISRTTATYGDVVKDPNGNDVIVDHNKYFHTIVDYRSNDDKGSSSPSHNCQHNTTYLVYCNSTGFESNIDVYEYKTSGYKKIANVPNLLETKYTGDLSAGKWSHTDNNPTTSGSITFTYCEDKEAHTFEDPCALKTPIVYIIERGGGGGYAHWNFYEYDEGSSTYVINASYSCASGGWPAMPGNLTAGKYYHVTCEDNWSRWKTNDPTRASATYVECSEASIDHVFGS